MPLPVDDIRTLLPDWRAHLESRNLSPLTVRSYTETGRFLADFLVARELPTAAAAIAKRHLEAFLADRLEHRQAAATVARHYRNMQQLFGWLVDEDEVAASPMARMHPPQVPDKPVPYLTDDELIKLLKACAGKTYENRRDTAIIRALLDTGVRVAELAALQLRRRRKDRDRDEDDAAELSDVDFDLDVLHVVAKGRRPRSVPFGTRTADALRRYLRARARHPKAAASDAFWLGAKGPMTDSGIRQMLERRGADAGVPNVYPHRFRHTGAHAWLEAGGQETDLMRLMGWRSRQMVARYAASAAEARARQAHKRMALGDRV